MIKELIKEKLHGRKQISEKRKERGTGKEKTGADMELRCDIDSSSVSEVSDCPSVIGRAASWHRKWT